MYISVVTETVRLQAKSGKIFGQLELSNSVLAAIIRKSYTCMQWSHKEYITQVIFYYLSCIIQLM